MRVVATSDYKQFAFPLTFPTAHTTAISRRYQIERPAQEHELSPDSETAPPTPPLPSARPTRRWSPPWPSSRSCNWTTCSNSVSNDQTFNGQTDRGRSVLDGQGSGGRTGHVAETRGRGEREGRFSLASLSSPATPSSASPPLHPPIPLGPSTLVRPLGRPARSGASPTALCRA
ncbi:hypothetical protein BC938DRAFT_476750 [Jimgerdemannia flammicorona]|uniref:Uncharacterized protein n=1 Tax=Jimgerdemannia flammicorona TaxID=994334 RepID=A0A433QQ60_9FUNG|nr:hypothetical protein BC938DRAFT_476750 [Jimgerdemannia flammicorona]